MRKEPLRRTIIIYSIAPIAVVIAAVFVPINFAVRLIGASWEISDAWIKKIVGDA
jgi:hypothetical protein